MEYTLKLRTNAAFSLNSVSLKITGNILIRDKMKNEFNILNKEICKIFTFFLICFD